MRIFQYLWAVVLSRAGHLLLRRSDALLRQIDNRPSYVRPHRLEDLDRHRNHNDQSTRYGRTL